MAPDKSAGMMQAFDCYWRLLQQLTQTTSNPDDS